MAEINSIVCEKCHQPKMVAQGRGKKITICRECLLDAGNEEISVEDQVLALEERVALLEEFVEDLRSKEKSKLREIFP